MNGRPLHPIDRLRRAFWRWRGEQRLLITYWPNDYCVGTNCSVDDRSFRVTRYARTADREFYEVWGRELPGSTAAVQAQRAESDPDRESV